MSITWKNCLRVGVSIFILYLCIYYWDAVSSFLGLLLGAIVPILTGLAIAYVLNILMSFYERHYFTKVSHTKIVRKTKRPVCLMAAILTLCGIIALVIGLVVPELVSCVSFLVSEIPPIIQRLLQTEWVIRLLPENWLATLSSIDWMSYISKFLQVVGSGFGDAVTTVVSAVASVFSTIVTVFLSIIFALYTLLSKEKMQNQCKRLARNYLRPNWAEAIGRCCSVMNDCFRRFIVGQCTEAVILGLLCFVGMWIFRFPYATMISVLVGFTALIPVAGAYIGAGVGAVMMLTESPLKALLFLVFIVVLQQLEGNLIYPKVVGDSIGLPAFFVLAAITVGGSLGGILGMLLGVPLTATVYRLVRDNMKYRETLRCDK